MPIILYSVPEAVDWLSRNGMKITREGLHRAMKRGAIHHTRMGSIHVLSQEDLEYFLKNPPHRGRPIKG